MTVFLIFILVVEYEDHDLVLRQSFLNAVKFSQDYKPDGVFGTIIHPQTKKLVVFHTLSPKDLTNQTKSYIFFNL